MGATGNRERIELDRAETTEDLEHGLRPSLERTRGSERVARDEKATCGLGGDPHAEDASRWRAGLLPERGSQSRIMTGREIDPGRHH